MKIIIIILFSLLIVGCNNSVTEVQVTTEVVEVKSLTGRIWMDRNLGASQVATCCAEGVFATEADKKSYGDLYQWGRGADGHEKLNFIPGHETLSSTTTSLSAKDVPGHGNFIISNAYPDDWRSPQNNDLWQGVNGSNNPCPIGYRLPTDAEWEAERLSWSSNDAIGAFASPLKLPLAGYRDLDSSIPIDTDTYGYYWSSSVCASDDGTDKKEYSRYLFIGNKQVYGNPSGDAIIGGTKRVSGLSVRCIKDLPIN
jgi:uncharacterized protein (TIGR02145 family)